MSKITSYPVVSSFDEDDVLLKDGVNGTKIIKVLDAAKEFAKWTGTKFIDEDSDKQYMMSFGCKNGFPYVEFSEQEDE